MSDVTLVYVGPHDAVEIAATGDEVARNATVKVDAELAGRAPDARLMVAHAELAAATAVVPDPAWSQDEAEAHFAALAALHAEIPTIDAGEGLLAQPDNWQLAAKAAPKESE